MANPEQLEDLQDTAEDWNLYRRGVPDVAADADPNTALAVYSHPFYFSL